MVQIEASPRSFALVALLFLLSFTSVYGGSPAGIKIINALPPPILDFSYVFVDVLVNGSLVFSRLEYLMGSSGNHSYVPLDAPATYNVSFRYSNHPELGSISSSQLQTQPGTYHTIVIFGRNTAAFPIQTAHLIDQAVPTPLGAREDLSVKRAEKVGMSIVEGGESSLYKKERNGKGTASIRYFNGGISFSATTVKVNGRNLFTSTPYGQAWNGGNYVEIDASTSKDGVFDFEVVDARYEEIQITFDQLQLTNGCAFTLFTTGVLGNYFSPLMIVDTADLCSSPRREVVPPIP